MFTKGYLERVLINHHESTRWAKECDACANPFPCPTRAMATEILALRRELALRPKVKIGHSVIRSGLELQNNGLVFSPFMTDDATIEIENNAMRLTGTLEPGFIIERVQ